MPNAPSLIYHFPISHFFPLNLKFNPRAFRILTFMLIGVLLTLFVFQINSVIQKTYSLKNYEKELVLLSEKNRNLEIKVAQLNSLENVESLVRDLNYEKIGEISYIQLMEPQVVSK